MKLNSEKIRYYIWQFVSGFYFLYPLQGVYFFSRGITPTELALYLSISSIATTLLEIPTGFIADKLSRKLSVSLGYLFQALGYTGMIFVHNFYHLIPLAFIFALAGALRSGAEDALVYDELKRKSEEHEYLKLTSRGAVVGTISGAIASFTLKII